jgi:Protein of unknown function (DUF4238)
MAKDHFFPQFYLRNFQIPAEPGLIFEYRRNEAPKAVAIKTVAQEEDYYDLKRDDAKTDELEVRSQVFFVRFELHNILCTNHRRKLIGC